MVKVETLDRPAALALGMACCRIWLSLEMSWRAYVIWL